MRAFNLEDRGDEDAQGQMSRRHSDTVSVCDRGVLLYQTSLNAPKKTDDSQGPQPGRRRRRSLLRQTGRRAGDQRVSEQIIHKSPC